VIKQNVTSILTMKKTCRNITDIRDNTCTAS